MSVLIYYQERVADVKLTSSATCGQGMNLEICREYLEKECQGEWGDTQQLQPEGLIESPTPAGRRSAAGKRNFHRHKRSLFLPIEADLGAAELNYRPMCPR